MFKLRRLEERIVLDGAAIVDAVNEIELNDAHDAQMEFYADDAGNVEEWDYFGAAAGVADVEESGVHVLVVSSDIADSGDLAAAAKDDVVVVRYDASDTSLEDLADLIEELLVAGTLFL